MKKRGPAIGFVIGALFAVGCAPQAPTMRVGDREEITHDGLHRVDHAGFAAVWVKPGAELGRYSKILPGEPSFHYRAVKGGGRSMSGEYEVPERRRDQFEKIVKESFAKAFAKSKYYTLATEPGPDTLILLGAVHDIVSHVPPERGRETAFVSEIGEATIVLELRDSQTNEVLARAAERRTIEPTSGGVRASPVASASEVRKTAALWGSKLRDQLDALHEH
jgi:hypothetical protein